MLTRRSLFVAIAAAAWAARSPAVAGGHGLFTEATFEAAQKTGRPILVDISAAWCSTCKAQKPILRELSKSETFKDFVMLEVDFDSQKDVVRTLGARSQSTLIVFKGSKEVGRSIGDTNPESIKALLTKAL